jgi:hypothetical protein
LTYNIPLSGITVYTSDYFYLFKFYGFL